MNFKTVLCWLAIIIIFSNCSEAPTDKEGTSAEKSTVHVQESVEEEFVSPFETKTIVKSYNDCDPEDGECTYAKLTYPIISLEDNTEIETQLNDEIIQFLTNDTYVENWDPEEMLTDFINNYSKMKTDDEDYVDTWYQDHNIEVSYLSDHTISMTYSQSSYEGGAHPNSFIVFKNFTLDKGIYVELRSVLEPNKMQDFKILAEEIFRADKGITTDANLNDYGYTFAGGQFSLTDNFGLSNRGLHFYYNSYEIAPYSMGSTDLLIPYSRLTDLVRPKYRSAPQL